MTKLTRLASGCGRVSSKPTLPTAGQSHHARHSRESENPVSEIVSAMPDSFPLRPLDSGFRRSDGCAVYDAIALCRACDIMDERNACLRAGKPVRIEHVVLGGVSVESIKQAHARYFWGEYKVLVPMEIGYLTSWRDDLPRAQAEGVAVAARSA